MKKTDGKVAVVLRYHTPKLKWDISLDRFKSIEPDCFLDIVPYPLPSYLSNTVYHVVELCDTYGEAHGRYLETFKRQTNE